MTRRFKGYSTDSRHALIGTMSLYNLMAVVGAFLMGQEIAKRFTAHGPMQSAFAIGLAVGVFVLTLILRREFAAKPKYIQHWWQFWNGDDQAVVRPDARPVPLLSRREDK
ncbi:MULTISPECIES: hypothetical protein [unclassified Deinococcus]|uniref:hypothetical protein n=1 Tax=unclassified Deinococcus TaxID=2623546 RepID=UPI001C2F9DD1|nr:MULTISPECIES: hypothetical protein [unclassified Deinococcus]MDK2014386.1 hypothetical protein [Deinococcus sp. 43]